MLGKTGDNTIKNNDGKGISSTYINISKVDVRRMRPHSFQCCLNTRQKSLTLRVAEHWNTLPREIVHSSPLETLKTHLGHISVSPALGDPALAGGLH